MKAVVVADAVAGSSFNPSNIFEIFFCSVNSMLPASESWFTYNRDALINTEKVYVGFGLSAADHERIPPVAFAKQAARPAGENVSESQEERQHQS